MGFLDRFRTKQPEKIAGSVVNEAYREETPPDRSGIIKSSLVQDNGATRVYISPIVDFETQFTYYYTIGKIQNSVDNSIDNISTRDYYFAPVDEKMKFKTEIAKMEQWASDYRCNQLIKEWLRNGLVCGNNLVSKTDWVNVQMSAIVGVSRDDYGNPEDYWQHSRKGLVKLENPDDFIHFKWIDVDRQPWGIGRFFSIFNNQFSDPDVKNPKAPAAIYRTVIQDAGKIHHKLAAPRVIYAVPGVSKEVFDADIKPLFEQLKPGGRIALAIDDLKMQGEPVDGTTRFKDLVDMVVKEVDQGSQSTANRLISEPSSMADARVGDEQDDESDKAAMDWIKDLMDNEVIPAVLGEKYRGVIEFRWGSQDDFELDFDQLAGAVSQGIVAKTEAREILKSTGWKLDDAMFEQEETEKAEKQEEIMTGKTQKEGEPQTDKEFKERGK